jgi:hypothetical protein
MAAIDTIADRSTGSAIAGKAYFETSTNKLIVFNGTAWIELDSDGVGAVSFENRWGASFDGSDDSFTFTGSTDIQLDQTYTVCSWFKINSTSTQPRGLITWGSANLGKGRGLYFNGSKVGSFGYGGSYNIDSSADISTGVWYHVAATYDGTTVKLYINGTLDTSSTISLNSFTYSVTCIGELYYSPTTSTRHFDGYLDDLALFNTTLSAADITKIYNGTAPNGKPNDLTLAASYDTSNQDQNLVGYWRMGDDSSDTASANGSIATITDSSGNGNDATQSTASSQPTFKALAQSVGTTLSFDGSNDYLTVTQNSDINITGDLTVSAWVRLSQISGYNAVLTKRAVSGSMNYQFTINSSGKIGLGHSGGSWVYDTNSLTVDTWHHVAATVSSGTVQFYIDGVAKSSDTGLTITGDTNDLTIGATVGYNYFSGTINEVAIFSTALSTSDITSLAASQTAHIVNDLSLSPVAYYRMGEDDSLTDGASASQITDASGNGNHATQATAANQPTASIEPIIYV